MNEPNIDHLNLLKELQITYSLATAVGLAQNSTVFGHLDNAMADLETEIVTACNPLCIEDVRSMPASLWNLAVFHLISSADTTLEVDDDETHPDFFCTDAWTNKLFDLPDEAVAAMVVRGTVSTPKEVMAWVDAQPEPERSWLPTVQIYKGGRYGKYCPE